MSIYPFYFEYERPRQCPRLRRSYYQPLGYELTPQEYLTLIAVPQASQDYFRPWRNLQTAVQDVGSTIREDRDKFQVNLDVKHFAPEEISVKTVDGYLIIEAKHEEKEDEHGFISRRFTRRYALPEGVDADSVLSKLSSDGVLFITAPLKVLKPLQKESNERVVPIVHTGPVKKQVEDKSEKEG